MPENTKKWVKWQWIYFLFIIIQPFLSNPRYQILLIHYNSIPYPQNASVVSTYSQSSKSSNHLSSFHLTCTTPYPSSPPALRSMLIYPFPVYPQPKNGPDQYSLILFLISDTSILLLMHSFFVISFQDPTHIWACIQFLSFLDSPMLWPINSAILTTTLQNYLLNFMSTHLFQRTPMAFLHFLQVVEKNIKTRSISNKYELKVALQVEWAKIPKSLTMAVNSMKRRFLSVIKSKGYPTK